MLRRRRHEGNRILRQRQGAVHIGPQPGCRPLQGGLPGAFGPRDQGPLALPNDQIYVSQEGLLVGILNVHPTEGDGVRLAGRRGSLPLLMYFLHYLLKLHQSIGSGPQFSDGPISVDPPGHAPVELRQGAAQAEEHPERDGPAEEGRAEEQDGQELLHGAEEGGGHCELLAVEHALPHPALHVGKPGLQPLLLPLLPAVQRDSLRLVSHPDQGRAKVSSKSLLGIAHEDQLVPNQVGQVGAERHVHHAGQQEPSLELNGLDAKRVHWRQLVHQRQEHDPLPDCPNSAPKYTDPQAAEAAHIALNSLIRVVQAVGVVDLLPSQLQLVVRLSLEPHLLEQPREVLAPVDNEHGGHVVHVGNGEDLND
mmetsp:Transcript_11925/g.26333  ORF Transcript_11925/g.26333 Transcript_11925/m.26333 type:complete len:365 (-) Transcript_11925:469-1563(-)